MFKFKAFIKMVKSEGYQRDNSQKGKEIGCSELAMYTRIAGGKVVALWTGKYNYCQGIVKNSQGREVWTSGILHSFSDHVSIS